MVTMKKVFFTHVFWGTVSDRSIRSKNLFLLFLFLILSLSTVHAQNTKTQQSDLQWTTKKIEKGIYWKNYKGSDFFDSKQNINLIEIFVDSVSTEFKLAFLEDSTVKTSQFAEEHEALIAVNGSYFRRDTGGSMVFVKADGSIIYEGRPGENRYQENGAIAWTGSQPFQILKRSDAGWHNESFDNILSSGPLLIFESEIQVFNNDPFHQNRHPRTAIAITNDRRLYLVTIDGRSFQAYGMTIPELTQFLKELGVEHALNLDGGGSTAMWIKNMTENGIVNYPSDNLEFDHQGERNVANALLILSAN